MAMLVKWSGTKKPTMVVLAEVCPRRRQAEECEAALTGENPSAAS